MLKPAEKRSVKHRPKHEMVYGTQTERKMMK